MKISDIKPGWYRGGRVLLLRRVHVVTSRNVVYTSGIGKDSLMMPLKSFARWAKRRMTRRIRVKAGRMAK